MQRTKRKGGLAIGGQASIESAIYEKDYAKLDAMIAADVMLHACMLTLKGIPVIYSGDELAMLNDYSYHDDPGRWADSRNIHRGKLNWDDAAHRNDKTTVTGRVFNAIRQLIIIRKYNEIFHSDAILYPVDTGDNRVLGIMREYNGKRMLGLFNFSESHCKVEIETEEWMDMINTGVAYMSVDSETSEYWLKPYDFRWMLADKN